jgi:hypothetical protein
MFYAITRMDYLDATALSLEAARQRSIWTPSPSVAGRGIARWQERPSEPLRFRDFLRL